MLLLELSAYEGNLKYVNRCILLVTDDWGFVHALSCVQILILLVYNDELLFDQKYHISVIFINMENLGSCVIKYSYKLYSNFKGI